MWKDSMVSAMKSQFHKRLNFSATLWNRAFRGQLGALAILLTRRHFSFPLLLFWICRGAATRLVYFWRAHQLLHGSSPALAAGLKVFSRLFFLRISLKCDWNTKWTQVTTKLKTHVFLQLLVYFDVYNVHALKIIATTALSADKQISSETQMVLTSQKIYFKLACNA